MIIPIIWGSDPVGYLLTMSDEIPNFFLEMSEAPSTLPVNRVNAVFIKSKCQRCTGKFWTTASSISVRARMIWPEKVGAGKLWDHWINTPCSTQLDLLLEVLFTLS